MVRFATGRRQRMRTRLPTRCCIRRQSCFTVPTKTCGSGNTEVVAMREASMQAPQGEVVALLGPSGPRVTLADEPTAALDSQRGRRAMELFAQVADEHGVGLLVVTHDHRALDEFDTIYAMEDGRMRHEILSGKWHLLNRRSASPFRRRPSPCQFRATCDEQVLGEKKNDLCYP